MILVGYSRGQTHQGIDFSVPSPDVDEIVFMWADDDKTYIGVYLDYAVVTAVLMVMFMYPIKNESQ